MTGHTWFLGAVVFLTVGGLMAMFLAWVWGATEARWALVSLVALFVSWVTVLAIGTFYVVTESVS